MASNHIVYRFKIEGVTPSTMSMKRLAEYITGVAELFGHDEEIHLIQVEEGSTIQCIDIDPSAVAGVDRRLLAIRTNDASATVTRTYRHINRKLAEDNISADIITPTEDTILRFPGRSRDFEQPVGPVEELTTIQGEIVEMSGRDESISVYVKEGASIYICHTNREMGKNLRNLLWEKVRLQGKGKWMRDREARWQLEDFQIESFVPLGTLPLTEAVAQMRAIKSPELGKLGEPWAVIRELDDED